MFPVLYAPSVLATLLVLLQLLLQPLHFRLQLADTLLRHVERFAQALDFVRLLVKCLSELKKKGKQKKRFTNIRKRRNSPFLVERPTTIMIAYLIFRV